MLAQRTINLKNLYESQGAARTCELLRNALVEGKLRPEEFSMKELADAFIEGGSTALLGRSGGIGDGLVLTEAPVDSTAFLNVMGQIVYSKIRSGYDEADGGVFDRIIQVVPTKFDGEKIPGPGEILDEEFVVGEGMEFPESGFGEDWQNTPNTVKRGLIVKITKESVFFDRTFLVTRQAGTVGKRLATGRLKRVLKVVMGATNNFNWRGTAYNTYLTSGNWINDHTNVLADYTDIVNAWKLFQNMTDPDTGNPIMIGDTEILCVPGNVHNVRRVINAVQVRQTASSIETLSANPVSGDAQDPIVSALLNVLLQSELSYSGAKANDTWFYGNFKEAFWYMQNWGLTVIQAPANNPEQFKKDVVGQWRADERGVAAVGNPRFVIRNNGA
jgi:hypothetical protein